MNGSFLDHGYPYKAYSEVKGEVKNGSFLENGSFYHYTDGHLSNGEYHEGDESSGKTIRWYKDGKLHREDGPAEYLEGGREKWWLNGCLHRTDGPAVVYPDGKTEWWVRGERHRLDGAAIEYADGTKFWWINGVQYYEDEFIHEAAKFKLHETLQSDLEVGDTKGKHKI